MLYLFLVTFILHVWKNYEHGIVSGFSDCDFGV